MPVDDYKDMDVRIEWAQHMFDQIAALHPGAPGFKLSDYPKERVCRSILVVDFILSRPQRRIDED